MKIEQETIYNMMVCENCKKVFSGEHAQFDGEHHAELLDHVVTGETRERITFAKRN